MPNTIPVIAAASAVAVSVAGVATYAALSSESQIFGRSVVAGNDPNQIALTFDDGPNDGATERLLEVLGRYEVRATFFMIGKFVRQRPELARTVAAAGHLIGNHTMTHPWLVWQSAARIREELMGCNAALEDALGAPVRFFRAPHGARRPYVLSTARELGLTPVQWNIIVGDWKSVPAETILTRIQRGIGQNRQRKRGSNIVLHDGGDQSMGQPRMPTVEATTRLLELCRSNNTKFVTPEVWA